MRFFQAEESEQILLFSLNITREKAGKLHFYEWVCSELRYLWLTGGLFSNVLGYCE